jgi:hypothetical protein
VFAANAQNNELFKLLNWNTQQQQEQLLVWYDLQDVKTIKFSNKQTGQVYSINDKGIKGNHILQADKKYQPLFTSNSQFNNGPKNGISFANGGYMTYKFPSTKSLKTVTSFVVCKNDIGGSKLLYDLSLEGGEGIASCYSGLYKIESRVPNSLVGFEPKFNNNPLNYLLISTKGSSGNIKSSLNEVNYTGPGTRYFQGMSYNRIRLSTENGVAPTDGTLYELILFNNELSEQDFQIVKNYLEKKYDFISNSTNQSLNPIQIAQTNLNEAENAKKIAFAQNIPEDNKKEFEKLLSKFNTTNSSNSSFSGYIKPYPSNPSDSYYKQDYYNNQLIYDGYMKKVVTSTNGNTVYQDVFKHGKGKEYIINSNGYLDGYFLNGKLNGYGEHVSTLNGFSYKGYFINGERNGEGILVMDGLNGTTKYIYEGTFSNGKFNGKGTITYNFMSYTGSFVNGEISGSGVYLHPNGSKYVGNSVNGKYDGFGEYYFADGSYYIGNFSNNKFNGNGELSNVNGTKQKGAWQNGNYVVETVKEDSPNISNNQPRSSLIEGSGNINNATSNTSQSNKTKSNDTELSDFIAAQLLSSNLLGNLFNGLLDLKIESNTSSSSKSSSSKNNSSVQNKSTSNSSNNQVCSYCKPYDNKGMYIHDYSVSNKTYINGRYVLRPGYKICDRCQGTGDCRVFCSGGKRDCPGVCSDSGKCLVCHGDRFTLCSRCKGTGKSLN